MHMKSGILIVFFVLLAMGASFAAGYFYLKSQGSGVAIVSEQPTPNVTIEPTVAVSPVISVTPTPTSVSKSHSAVVVFEPPLSGEFSDKAEIQSKIINPFLDYYADENGEGYLVSLAISQNTQASKTTYPYQATAIFKNGGNSGFVIPKTNGVINYWVPECMKCTFSASFKTKYPDIVKNFN